MNQNKSSPNSPISNLYDSFCDLSLNDLEEATLILKYKGIDPNKVTDKGMNLVNKLKAKSKIAIAVNDGKQILYDAKILLRDTLQKLENPKEFLVKALQGNSPELAVNFSKLENISIQEIEEMFSESQILDIIKNLKENKNIM
jgi:predicted transcriptional regulator